MEAQNFEARKHLLEYDDVMNKQRQAVYGMRRQLLEGVDQKERIMKMVAEHRRAFSTSAARRRQHPDTWDLQRCATTSSRQFGYKIDSRKA